MSVAVSSPVGDDVEVFDCGCDDVRRDFNHWDGDVVAGIVLRGRV